jgi:hypothetical protein
MRNLISRYPLHFAAIITIALMLALAPVVYAEWLNAILTTVSTSNGGDIRGFTPNPDSQHVVYWADADVTDQYELYSVPVTGGAVTKLNGVMATGGDVSAFMTLAGNRLLYRADQDVDEKTELFSVPYAGGPATRLNGDMIADGDVGGWAVSADYSYIIYSADQEVDGRTELYHVPLNGGVANKLNLPLLPGDFVRRWAYSSALEEVIYGTEFGSSSGTQADLYRVPISGGEVMTLTIPITTGETLGGITYNPTGERLIYYIGTFPYYRLNSIKLDGTDVQSLSGGTVIPNWGFSRDGQQVIYLSGNPLALYAAPIAGGAPTKLSADGGGGVIEWKVSLDGSRVVYWAYITGSGGDRGLYSVPLSGGTVTPLHSAPVQIYNSIHFQITADSARVVYLGEGYKLFSVPITGGASIQLTGPTGGSFRINPNTSDVVFIDDLDTANTSELYSVPITGGTPEKLNRPLTTSEDVTGLAITLDGRAVVYEVTGANYIELDTAYEPPRLYLPLVIR